MNHALIRFYCYELTYLSLKTNGLSLILTIMFYVYYYNYCTKFNCPRPACVYSFHNNYDFCYSPIHHQLIYYCSPPRRDFIRDGKLFIIMKVQKAKWAHDQALKLMTHAIIIVALLEFELEVIYKKLFMIISTVSYNIMS